MYLSVHKVIPHCNLIWISLIINEVRYLFSVYSKFSVFVKYLFYSYFFYWDSFVCFFFLIDLKEFFMHKTH